MPESRTVAVPRERLEPWLRNFSTRHGEPRATGRGDHVLMVAPDGAEARIAVPFPPLPPSSGTDDPVPALLAHTRTDRRVAALLVRRGGHAVGVFEGVELITSKVGSRHVQGRTKAGGWSQQRFARRRDNQAKKAWQAAADDAATHLAGEDTRCVTLVGGGDRPGVSAVLADPRLRGLRTLWQSGGAVVLPVDDPRQRVLAGFGAQFLALSITLNELA